MGVTSRYNQIHCIWPNSRYNADTMPDTMIACRQSACPESCLLRHCRELSRLSSPADYASQTKMPINPDRARRAAAPSAAIVVRNEASDSDEEANSRNATKGLQQVVAGAPAAAVAVRAAAPQAVRDHALVTYMGEPYLAQSPDTGPSPDTIRYIVSGPSPDTIDTNLPCRTVLSLV